MKKVKKRAYSAFLIAVLLIAGMTTYVVRFIMDGESWATFSGNEGVYESGKIAVGTVTDRNGTLLAKADENGKFYSDDSSIRVSTLHALGDYKGFIGTGALTSFADRLTGYSAIGGLASGGVKLELAIDSQLCVTAYYALAGRSGAVLVMDYTTGEIICMVSSPSYDPTIGFDEADSAYTGAYINRCISSKYTPGSVFKIVTLAAALENISDIYEREFTCEGSFAVGGYNVTCAGTHGLQTIEQAFANSCNCAFGNLALELGGETLAEYAQKLRDAYAYVLRSDKTEPVKNEYYTEAIAYEREVLATLESRLAESVNPATIEKRIATQKAYIETELARQEYTIFASAIKNYVEVILPGAFVDLPDAIKSSDRDPEMTGMFNRYIGGTLDAETLIVKVEELLK